MATVTPRYYTIVVYPSDFPSPCWRPGLITCSQKADSMERYADAVSGNSEWMDPLQTWGPRGNHGESPGPLPGLFPTARLVKFKVLWSVLLVPCYFSAYPAGLALSSLANPHPLHGQETPAGFSTLHPPAHSDSPGAQSSHRRFGPGNGSADMGGAENQIGMARPQ